MVRRVDLITFSVAAILYSTTNTAGAAAPKKDDFILPKSAGLRLEDSPGNQSPTRWIDQIPIGWPAKVFAVKGQWLKIGDDGGYTLPGKKPASGWVRKDEVIAIDENTESTYNSAIIATAAELEDVKTATAQAKWKLARLHWLLGICRQSKTPDRAPDPRPAIADFDKAICLDQGLADAWLRRGRLLAKFDAKESQPKWERCFATAYKQFVRMNAPKTSELAACANPARGIPSKPPVASAIPCQPEVVLPQAETRALDLPYSAYSPPQLYFEVGCAYQKLSDAHWHRTDAVQARKAADDATDEALRARGKAERLAKDAEYRRKEAERLANKAERAVRKQAERMALSAKRAAAKAKAAAANADVRDAKAEVEALKAEVLAALYREYFNVARKYFRLAKSSNPSWYRPPAAEADLFLARVKINLTEDFKGWPKAPLSARNLFCALKFYNESILRNGGFADAHRGRAEALWLLATAPKFFDGKMAENNAPAYSELRALLSGNDDETRIAGQGVLDAAYESASTASFLTYDRDPDNLKIRGKIEAARAYRNAPNRSVNDLALAKETFREGILYGRSTKERDKLNELMLMADSQSARVIAFIAADNDRLITQVSDRAKKLKPGVTSLCASANLPWTDGDFESLARKLVMARRAIAEIERFQTSGGRIPPETNDHEPWLLWLSRCLWSARRGGTPAMNYDELWPTPFPSPGELMDRDSRIRAWNAMFDELTDDLKDHLDTDTSPIRNKHPQLYEELEKYRGEWSLNSTTSGQD